MKRIPVEPPPPTSRAARFAELSRFVTERDGWIVSLPGSTDVTVECLPGSALPEQLRDLGHDVAHIGDGERILHSAIKQQFANGPDGELEPLVAGSTQPVALTVMHAGICRVKQYALRL